MGCGQEYLRRANCSLYSCLMEKMKPVEPILVAELFPELRERLLGVLRGLSDEEWSRPTAAGKWDVQAVALHLLAVDIGNLSRRRDAFTPRGKGPESWEELVAFLNELNATWVTAGRRMSPRVLCDLSEHVGPQMDEYFQSLDPFAMGGAVSWAGPQAAPVWLDIAREYTERWHHQQQIRDATDREGLYEARLFRPVIDAFLRGLPHAFREVQQVAGTCVQVTMTGIPDGEWLLRRGHNEWELHEGRAKAPAASVTLDAKDAWKIFTRGLRGDKALQRTAIEGDRELGAKVASMVSVIA